MRTAARTTAWIAAALLLLLFAVLALDIVSRDYDWVAAEYQKLGAQWYTDMSNEDKTDVFCRMLAYARGDADSLEDVTVTKFEERVSMFDARELAHMKDVRRLMTSVLRLRLILPVLIAALLIFSAIILKKQAIAELSHAFLVCLAVFAVVACALAIWAVADFSSFWVAFHVVFLDLESSVFDLFESRMMRVCPEELFYDMIVRFAAYAGAFTGAAAIAAGAYLLTKRATDRRKKGIV